MGKHGIVKIPVEKWGKLCDALNVSPDTELDTIILKVNMLQQWILELRRDKYLREKNEAMK